MSTSSRHWPTHHLRESISTMITFGQYNPTITFLFVVEIAAHIWAIIAATFADEETAEPEASAVACIQINCLCNANPSLYPTGLGIGLLLHWAHFWMTKHLKSGSSVPGCQDAEATLMNGWHHHPSHADIALGCALWRSCSMRVL